MEWDRWQRTRDDTGDCSRPICKWARPREGGQWKEWGWEGELGEREGAEPTTGGCRQVFYWRRSHMKHVRVSWLVASNRPLSVVRWLIKFDWYYITSGGYYLSSFIFFLLNNYWIRSINKNNLNVAFGWHRAALRPARMRSRGCRQSIDRHLFHLASVVDVHWTT